MPANKKEESFQLIIGSFYIVRSAETRDKPLETRGKFRGYASIGQEMAIAMELDESNGEAKGRIRIIPLPAILSVDILKAAEMKEEPKDKPESVYFG